MDEMVRLRGKSVNPGVTWRREYRSSPWRNARGPPA
jgi:hypothetical protein